MANSSWLRIGIFILCIGLFGCDRPLSYASDVRPIFDASCVVCHDNSAEGIATSGFSMADYDGIMKGTKFGPVVVPGSSISSSLYLVIAGKTSPEIQMPPQHENAWAKGRGTPLTDKQVEVIAAWIDQGAQNN